MSCVLFFMYKFCRTTPVIEEKQLPEGTIKDAVHFNAIEDCHVLHEALKGEEGRNEGKIIDIVAHRSNIQRHQLLEQYALTYTADLIEDLKSELGGQFLEAVLALFSTPDDFDASCLHAAMKSVCTPTESVLIEIMFSRSNSEIRAIIESYNRMHNSHLAEDLHSHDASCYFSKLFHSITHASTSRLAKDEDVVDETKAKEDAAKLHNENSWGTAGSHLEEILHSNNFEQLELIFRTYEKMAKMSVEEAIKNEASGDLEEGLLAIMQCMRNRYVYFAERLYETLKGAGTNDKTLIRVLVSRSEVDLVQIKEAFLGKYGVSLEHCIAEDINKLAANLLKSYKDLMVQICHGN